MCPFKVVYGLEPPPLLRLVEEASQVEEVGVMIKERNEILDKLKENLTWALERMKHLANENRRRLS